MTSTHETRRTSFDAVVDTDGVARASRHTLLAQVATQVSRLAVSVVLARLLTPAGVRRRRRRHGDHGGGLAADRPGHVGGDHPARRRRRGPRELGLLVQPRPRRGLVGPHVPRGAAARRRSGPAARPPRPSGCWRRCRSSGRSATCTTPCCGAPCSSAGSPRSRSPTPSSTAPWASGSPSRVPGSGRSSSARWPAWPPRRPRPGGSSRGGPRSSSASAACGRWRGSASTSSGPTPWRSSSTSSTRSSSADCSAVPRSAPTRSRSARSCHRSRRSAARSRR